MTDKRPILHYIILLGLATVWGIAFMFVKVALEGFGPLTISALRLTIGAFTISLLLYPLKSTLPSTLKQWKQCAIAGNIGTTLPFVLISWSIQYVNSSVAAICMSIIPLSTLLLAHKMTSDEKISVQKVIGIMFGMIGVAILFYDTIHIANDNLIYIALFALIFSAFNYALSGGLIKNLEYKDAIGSACAMLICASVTLWPIVFIFEMPADITPKIDAIFSILFLGLFSTGIATILLVHLTNLAGMTFVSYNTYFVPLVGIAAGYFFLSEPVNDIMKISVILILAGIFIAERKGKKNASS